MSTSAGKVFQPRSKRSAGYTRSPQRHPVCRQRDIASCQELNYGAYIGNGTRHLEDGFRLSDPRLLSFVPTAVNKERNPHQRRFLFLYTRGMNLYA
ncbi:hypothetical protein EYF80_003595 [Liparis tanakae]|uniref:Uncharacterized protein n=1 Tax=Liparis tanakae TaxID=230148 RepID=A0A4Z2J906_9TELE|nr:hypothetical protein EYF80_003595 [Liparis tanakae]